MNLILQILHPDGKFLGDGIGPFYPPCWSQFQTLPHSSGLNWETSKTKDNQRSLATNWKMISLSGVRSTLCKKEASERKARTKDCFSPDPPGHSLRMLQRGSSIVLHLTSSTLTSYSSYNFSLILLTSTSFFSDYSIIDPLTRNAISSLFFSWLFSQWKAVEVSPSHQRRWT